MMQDNIISKEPNIDGQIYKIMNEAYHEFVQMYGTKHSEYIKKQIENITDKVRYAQCRYRGGELASANAEKGVVYSESHKLSAVLKHELWHVYNYTAADRENSLQYIPKRYMEKLEETGYLKNLYDSKIANYKEKFKDEPQRLQYLLKDFEYFKNNQFDFEDSPVEMWAEWFNSKTHIKDMQDNFSDWGNGFFTKNHSSGSYYDSYINVADMISCIVPKNKLLDMYLNSDKYKTDYSYPEMLEEFDTKYIDALDKNEKNEYGYPYLKIIMNVKTVSENAKKNPQVALEALQTCMKTCFNAYRIKLDNIKEIDVDKAKQIYSEIKYMQEHMVWNIDINKMKDLDYIKSMKDIQEKFKEIVSNLNLENKDIQNLIETIDYEKANPYKLIENGEKISEKIEITKNENKECETTIGHYKSKVGKNGIEDNLYASLFTLLGDKKYNLLFEKFQNKNEDNILSRFYKMIESSKTEEDVTNIYGKIYDLYARKLNKELLTNENVSTLFDNYSKEIVELQKNGLFNAENQQYYSGLEEVIKIYNEKVVDYEQTVNKIAEEDKQNNLSNGEPLDKATMYAYDPANKYKQELEGWRNRIDKQRKIQLEEYQKKEYKDRNIQFTEQQIGKVTIGISTEKKDKAMSRVNQDVQLFVDKENKKEGEEL